MHNVFQHTEPSGLLVKGASSSEDFSKCLEGMEGYRHGRNSVTEVPFQISQKLPQQPLSLKQQVQADYLRELIARDPHCTLKQLCNWVREERGIPMSTIAMCRLVKGCNLQRRRSHLPHVYPSRSLALAA